MMPLLYTIPAALVNGVQSGSVQLVGAVLKDVATGQILGHVQQTGLLDVALKGAMQGHGSTVTGGFNPLSVVTVIQNQQIKAKLVNVQSTLGILQNLQMGSLAVSGMGLGVSVVGFAVMLQRLKGIEQHLGVLEHKIEQVTADRRADDLQKLFADIATALEAVDTLALRSNKVIAAEGAHRDLARAAGHLEVEFSRNVKALEGRRAQVENLDVLWTLGSAIRLCHEAGLRSMFMIDELDAAKVMAETRANKILELGSTFTPDSLARLCVPEGEGLSGSLSARRAALPSATTLVEGMRQSAASIASQADLAIALIDKGVAGSDFLKTVVNEKEEPLLYLPR